MVLLQLEAVKSHRAIKATAYCKVEGSDDSLMASSNFGCK